MKNISDFLLESFNESWTKVQEIYGDNNLLYVTYNDGRYEDPFADISSDQFEEYDDIIHSAKDDKSPYKDIKLSGTDTYIELHACDLNGDFMHWVIITNSKNKFTTYVYTEDSKLLTSFDTFNGAKCNKLMNLLDHLAGDEHDEKSIADIDKKIKAI
jgi:hypothetical protein